MNEMGFYLRRYVSIHAPPMMSKLPTYLYRTRLRCGGSSVYAMTWGSRPRMAQHIQSCPYFLDQIDQVMRIDASIVSSHRTTTYAVIEDLGIENLSLSGSRLRSPRQRCCSKQGRPPTTSSPHISRHDRAHPTLELFGNAAGDMGSRSTRMHAAWGRID